MALLEKKRQCSIFEYFVVCICACAKKYFVFVIGSSSLSSGSAAAGPRVALLEKKRHCSGVAAGYTSLLLPGG